MRSPRSRPEARRSTRAFRTFWLGQFVSNLGGSFTYFALPLLAYRLTGSPVGLAVTTVAENVPYLLFGLPIGAWVDRLDRRKLMIGCDVGRAAALAILPLLASTGSISIWCVYAVAFLVRTLELAFTAAEFAAVKSLVPSSDLERANGRIQGSYQIAYVVGPMLAGALVGTGLPVVDVFALDACSFVVSALTLKLVRARFNDAPRPRKSVRHEVLEGLRYVFGHPILRNISLVAALANLFGMTLTTQLVFFAKTRLGASDARVGGLYAAGALGIAALTVAAPLTRRFASFRVATLGSLMLYGALAIVLATIRTYWVAIPLWALTAGLPYAFSIHTVALRQRIVPDHLFGRVMTVAMVVAWSVNALGAAVGAWAIVATGSVPAVYAALGGMILVSTSLFWFTALGRAGDPEAHEDPEPRELTVRRRSVERSSA